MAAQRSNPLVPSQRDASDSGDLSAVCLLAPLSVTHGRQRARRHRGREGREGDRRRSRAGERRRRCLLRAESHIDQLDLQQNQLQSEITALEGDVKALQLAVENVAIGRYTQIGQHRRAVADGFQAPEDQSRSMPSWK